MEKPADHSSIQSPQPLLTPFQTLINTRMGQKDDKWGTSPSSASNLLVQITSECQASFPICLMNRLDSFSRDFSGLKFYLNSSVDTLDPTLFPSNPMQNLTCAPCTHRCVHTRACTRPQKWRSRGWGGEDCEKGSKRSSLVARGNPEGEISGLFTLQKKKC